MKIVTAMNTAFEVGAARPVLGFWPVGATEQHSRHLPLLTDTLLADALSARILERVGVPGVAYLLPTLPWSSSEENTGFVGTLNLTPLALRAIVRDSSDSLRRVGIPRLVICAWHGGNFILKPVIRELNHELNGAHLVYLNPYDYLPAEILRALAPGFEVHCGELETSLMLALNPDWVGPDRRDNPQPFHPAWQDLHSMKTLSKGEGHAGHPTRATVEKGQRFLEALVAGAAAGLAKLLQIADSASGY